MSFLEHSQPIPAPVVRRVKKNSLNVPVTKVYPEVRIDETLTIQRVFLDVKLAEGFLSTRAKTGQRPIKPHQVRMLMAQLDRGLMVLNGEPILFDELGGMVDGQQRCTAVINTGIGFWVLVIRGLDPDVIKTFGGGAKRMGADYLKGLGYANAPELATTATLMYRYQNSPNRNPFDHHMAVHNPFLDQVLIEHETLPESITFTYGCKAVCGIAGAAFCHYLFGLKDRKAADAMFTSLANGQDLKAGSPILILREYVLKLRAMEGRTDDRRAEIVTDIIRAWNAIRENKPLKNIARFDSKADFPEIL